ncbi:MAG: PAS domain S-box protein, partial [Candidatus Delongbacteria bacterium]|nr:PAS domain S-box protein [Candidatus Delongbacteria bacterium]
MAEVEQNKNILKKIAFFWRPSYAVYISIIVALVATLMMIGNHLQYFRIMKAVENTQASALESSYGYSVLILIGFVDLLILLGGVLIYTIQHRRKYSSELSDLMEELKTAAGKYNTIHERYELITENITDVILTMDMQGKITYITPSVEAYLGTKYTEMIGNKIEVYLTKRSVKALSKDIIYRRQKPDEFKEVSTNEIELMGKENQIFWVELKTIGYSEKGQQKGYLGVFRDITQRRKTENHLKFQSDVLYNISDEITIVDLDGKILYVNKAVLKDLNINKEDILGKVKTVLLPDPEYNVSKTDVVNAVKEKGHWEGIVGNYRLDGSRRIVSSRAKLIYDENNLPIGMFSISSNITSKIEM